MSSPLSEPTDLIDLECEDFFHGPPPFLNLGESSRQGQLSFSAAQAKRQPARTSPRRHAKRQRGNTPLLTLAVPRSTSHEQNDQNASAVPSLGAMTGTGGEEGSSGDMAEQAEQSRKRELLDECEEDGGSGDLFSERTQPLEACEDEGDEDGAEDDDDDEGEEDFLPEEDDELRDPTDFDDPISLGDGQLFHPVGGDEGEEDEEDEADIPLAGHAIARASDYLPCPHPQAEPTSRSTTDETSTLSARPHPRRSSRPDRMSQVLDQAQITGTQDADACPEEYSSGSYHSGDSDEFDMGHRPLLERTAVKRDIKEFLAGFPEMMAERYAIVDRLGEGE
jgi:cell division control protein 7